MIPSPWSLKPGTIFQMQKARLLLEKEVKEEEEGEKKEEEAEFLPDWKVLASADTQHMGACEECCQRPEGEIA